MTMTMDKLDAATDAVRAEAEEAHLLDRGATLSVLADAQRALKRIQQRATPLPEEFERVELVQSRGPVIEFTGRSIASTEFQTRGRAVLNMRLEIWQTAGGAYVAVSSAMPVDGGGFEDTRAIVVERQDDELAMRLAVMEAFDWSDRARSMVRKQLGWSIRVEVA